MIGGRLPVTTVVIVPARNEARRIAQCLRAIAAQPADGLAVVLLANNCEDRTVPIAQEVADATALRLEVLQCTFDVQDGVGKARRLGCTHALGTWPEAEYLLTTDADCVVAPNWIAMNRRHLAHASAVCGRVEPMTAELSVLKDIEILPAEMEARYEALVMEFYRHFRPGPCGLDGDHGCTAGASLAVRVWAYRAVGGFADLVTGEDRDLVRRLKTAGFGVRHAGEVRVAASCRLTGRATGGMSEALRARARREAYVVDEALPSAQMLIDAIANDTLGPWPLHTAASDRLNAHDLAPHIARLEEALRAVQAISQSRIAHRGRPV